MCNKVLRFSISRSPSRHGIRPAVVQHPHGTTAPRLTRGRSAHDTTLHRAGGTRWIAWLLLVLLLPMPAAAGTIDTDTDTGTVESKRPAAAGPGEQNAWQYRLLDADGAPLPDSSDEEIIRLLHNAEVVSSEEIGRGITRPHKLLLELDGIRLHAIFRQVDTRRQTRPGDRTSAKHGCTLATRDSYRYELAAYELSRLLGLARVPPVVLRTCSGKQGSLQLWLEHTITESRRRAQQLEPPDPQRWRDQWQLQTLFDSLIANRDRNLGNTLIDPGWTLWFIDHTRAFTLTNRPLFKSRVLRCERQLWHQLQTLDSDKVRERLTPYLSPFELDALLHRWSKLVQHLQEQIEKRGQESVLFDMPQPKDGPAPWGVTGAGEKTGDR